MTNIYIMDNKISRRESLRKVISTLNTKLDLTVNDNKEVFIDKPICEVDSGYSPDYCPTCTVDCEYIPMQKPFILFIHASNRCFYRFVSENIDNALQIIAYSGGTKEGAYSYQRLVTDNISDKIIFEAGLSPDATEEVINQKLDIEGLLTAIVSGNKEVPVLRENKGKTYLSALSILCIGFLAQYKEGFCPVKLEASPPNLKDPSIWKKVLGQDEIEAKKNLGQSNESVNTLIAKIYSNSLSDPNIIGNVEEAYLSIPGCSL